MVGLRLQGSSKVAVERSASERQKEKLVRELWFIVRGEVPVGWFGRERARWKVLDNCCLRVAFESSSLRTASVTSQGTLSFPTW